MQEKQVYRSHDSGTHFQLVANSSHPRVGDIQVDGSLAHLHVLTASSALLILNRTGPFTTTDGGAHWHPSFAFSPDTFLGAAFVLDAHHIWLVADAPSDPTDQERRVVWRTSDGLHWQPL
jgi:hypothetical protein